MIAGDWKKTTIKEGDLEEEEADARRQQERAYKERNKDKLRKGNIPRSSATRVPGIYDVAAMARFTST